MVWFSHLCQLYIDLLWGELNHPGHVDPNTRGNLRNSYWKNLFQCLWVNTDYCKEDAKLKLRRGVRSYVQCGCNLLAKFWRVIGCFRGIFNLERMRSFPHDYHISVCLPLRGESKPIWGGRVWQDSRRLLSPCHGCAIKIVRTKVTKKLFGNKWASEGRPDQGGRSVNAKPGSDPGCLIYYLYLILFMYKSEWLVSLAFLCDLSVTCAMQCLLTIIMWRTGY